MNIYNLIYLISLHLLIATLMPLCSANGEDEEKAWEFDVIPGGQELSFREQFLGASCEFTYRCQGGTKEKWLLRIVKVPDGDYVCEIERPGGDSTGSYLFFQEFKVKVGGRRLANGIVYGENKMKPLNPAEYLVDTNSHTVSSTSSFESHLVKIVIIMSKDKEEL